MEINGIWRGLIENLPHRHKIPYRQDFKSADKLSAPLKKVV
jgi:hypothetical protein